MEYIVAILASLSLLFGLMKLYGALDWPWIWILAPVWIPLAVVGAALVIMIVVLMIKGIITFW